jgi:membrane fusion protein (multidrug efflux system)
MVSKANGLDEAAHEVPTVPASDHPLAPGVVIESELADTRPPTKAKGAVPQDRQPGGIDPSREHADDTQRVEKQDAREPRANLLRRHPIAIPTGALAFALVLFAGYLYWDYAAHFESTDDAFVAARQFAVAP